MSFAVFIHREDLVYADEPGLHYQFPKQYLSRVLAAVGGWIIYYEPTKVQNSRGYYAVARLSDVVDDDALPGMYRARIEANSYLEFPRPVPFIINGSPIERGVVNAEGRISGRAQAAVRSLSESDFGAIVSLGLADEEVVLPRSESDVVGGGELDEEQAPFQLEQERIRVEMLASRTLRDRAFRKVVIRAYDARCAVTGLKLINGGGRAEVAAAHIRPVERNGPDILSNGVALSGTAHWMFDRGLIGLSDNYKILISRHVNDREGVESMINQTGHLIAPLQSRDRPHPAFLRWHRENVFKT